MRDLFVQIQIQLQKGKLLSCTKVKHQIGRCAITLGRYQTAVPDSAKSYAMIINNDPHFYAGASSAARAFIDFVGRDIAKVAWAKSVSK